MNNKYKIAILGMGGVGGYIGGNLAKAYTGSDKFEVIFIARGSNGNEIRANGLRLVTTKGDETVYPNLTSQNADEIGKIDFLICCTKAFSTIDSISGLKNCINSETVILPLLNGVDNTEKIRQILPVAKVLYGCMYIVSKLTAPGIVKQYGDYHSLHFGSSELSVKQLDYVKNLLRDAGINVTLESNPIKKLWEKYSFISPIATYTSTYDIDIGKILENVEHSDSLRSLMIELLNLADKMHVNLPNDIIEKNFAIMEKLPYETTSSMQIDFSENRQSELETLTGFVVKNAERIGISVPYYSKLYKQLINKSQ